MDVTNSETDITGEGKRKPKPVPLKKKCAIELTELNHRIHSASGKTMLGSNAQNGEKKKR